MGMLGQSQIAITADLYPHLMPTSYATWPTRPILSWLVIHEIAKEGTVLTVSVSAFFTAYSARLGGEPVEAVAVLVGGEGDDMRLRFVVVDAQGHASIADAADLDLYGVADEDEQNGQGQAEVG